MTYKMKPKNLLIFKHIIGYVINLPFVDAIVSFYSRCEFAHALKARTIFT